MEVSPEKQISLGDKTLVTMLYAILSFYTESVIKVEL